MAHIVPFGFCLIPLWTWVVCCAQAVLYRSIGWSERSRVDAIPWLSSPGHCCSNTWRVLALLDNLGTHATAMCTMA